MHSQPINRRTAITSIGAAAAGAAVLAARPANAAMLANEQIGFDPATNRYTLPSLKYAYDALEPAIDEQTMRLHHDKHHAGYVRGLNKALDKLDEIRGGNGDASLIKHWSRELAFHGSGHLNHCVFWNSIAPGEPTTPQGTFASAINASFGSLDAMLTHFKAASKSVEGSGWGWIVYEPTARKLLVMQSEKHQNLSIWGVVPIIAIDVWEHAYYLKYQNRRTDYIAAFTTIIDWAAAARRYENAAV
jgi:Fe-Mn family superoxide dismutase